MSVAEKLSARTQAVMGLALLAAVCAAANLTKPVHMDDAAYLAIVNWVASHPLHPMLGLLNWANTAQPISVINQPLLYIYLQALLQTVVGPSLLAQHALMALMSAGVVVVFYRLARLTGAAQPLLLTALLVLGPVFLPGQNLMMDVPTLLCWLICFWSLLGGGPRPASRRLAVGAAALAAGLLIKYTSLVLLPIFALMLVWRGQWRQLWLLAIPLGALAAWSLFNLWDYGSIHILTRSVGAVSLGRYVGEAASWLAGLGAVAPFTIIFFKRLPNWRWVWPALGLIAAAVWAVMAYRTQSLLLGLAWGLVIGNGCLALGLAGWADLSGSLVMWPADDFNLVLMLWLAGAGAFAVLFAPFMAVRHLMLAVPALLLLLGRNFRPSPRLAWVGLALTAALGLWLAGSDFAFASVYPDLAGQTATALPTGGTHWTVGHWGWQWYAPQAGLVEYDTEHSLLAAGDSLVAPALVHQQTLPAAVAQRLALVDTVTVPATPLTWLRTMSAEPWGGYYDFSISTGALPWTWSTAPVEVFRIYRVQ